MKVSLKLVAICASTMLVAVSASATPMLRITDPVTLATVTITDELAGDTLLGSPGLVGYSGSIGANWTVVVSTGITKPAVGTATDPFKHLNSVQLTSTGSGPASIVIEFTEDFYGPTSDPMTHEVSVSIPTGSALFDTWADTTNTPFGQGTLLASQGPFVNGAFAQTVSSNPGALGFPYSLTQIVYVSHTGGLQTSSFDFELRVPSPSSLMLLGSGVIGMILVSARSRKGRRAR